MTVPRDNPFDRLADRLELVRSARAPRWPPGAGPRYLLRFGIEAAACVALTVLLVCLILNR